MLLNTIAAILGIGRIAGIKGAAFQAAAHLFVGGLFGAYFAGKKRHHLILGLGLSALELACFLWFKYHG